MQVASTTCLRSSSLPPQVVTSEREATGRLRQLPLPSILNGGLQSVLHPPNTSPFPASSLMYHCMAPPIRTWHRRKNSRPMGTERYPYLRDKSALPCHWILHTQFPKTRFRLVSSRPSQGEEIPTHLVVRVPDCPRTISSTSVLHHWMTTTCPLSRGKSLALGWSLILSTVLTVTSLLVHLPHLLTVDDVHRYLQATVPPTHRFLIFWAHP